MSIESYREITKERLAAIEKARKAVARVNNLYWSTYGSSALVNLQLVKLEVEADLRAHERVASENAVEHCVQPTCATCGDTGRANPTLSEPDGVICPDCGTSG